MAKPFKFRYVNEIAGTFASAIALVLIISIILAGRAQRWFQAVTHITVNLPSGGSYGLKTGGEVRIMGVSVGAVDQINPPTQETDQMTMVVHVDPRFAQFIRSGATRDGRPVVDSASRAIIRIPLGIGDPYLEITRGDGPALAKDAVLFAEPETGATDAINQVVADVRTRTLPQLDALLKQYTLLASDLRSPDGPFQQSLTHIDHIGNNLERPDTVIGQLTADKDFAGRLNEAILKLSASMDEIHAVLGSLQTSTAQLPQTMTSLKETADTLPGVMLHTQQTMIEVQKLAKGLQSLPIISSSIDHTPPAKTLQPTDVGGAR